MVVPGIENRLQLLYHHGVGLGNISLNRFVELVSTAPARIFGMYPKKGVLAPGSDADIVLWDTAAAHTISAATHHMHVDYSMFEGFHVRGNARDVYSRGELIVSNGNSSAGPAVASIFAARRAAVRGSNLTAEPSLFAVQISRRGCP